VAVGLAMVALSLHFLLDAIPAMVRNAAFHPTDGLIDWGGAREMWAGRDPYGPAGLKAIGLNAHLGLGHPPTTLIWFYPLVGLDMMMMKHVFAILTLVMLLYHVAIVTRALQLPMWPFLTLLVFSGVYQMDWFILHLSQVDVSELIAFLYVLCWLYLRQGRDGLAGTMMGLACTLKLYPGIMVLFLLASRRWRAVGFAALAYLAFAAEAVRRLGAGGFKHFLEQTGSYADLWIANIRNASVDGIVHRLFYPVWRSRSAGRPVLLSATLISAALSLCLLAVAWWVSARRVRESRLDPERIDLPFSLFSILSMAPGPYQWEHYSVTLILPFLVLLAEAVRPPHDRRLVTRFVPIAVVLFTVFAMLDVDLRARIRAGRPLAVLAPSWDAVAHVVFYDVTTWLPWFILATATAVRIALLDRRQHGQTPTSHRELA
jgi:alpha-1,2-mannosyltransferase